MDIEQSSSRAGAETQECYRGKGIGEYGAMLVDLVISCSHQQGEYQALTKQSCMGHQGKPLISTRVSLSLLYTVVFRRDP